MTFEDQLKFCLNRGIKVGALYGFMLGVPAGGILVLFLKNLQW